MSPINFINKQYEQLLSTSIDSAQPKSRGKSKKRGRGSKLITVENSKDDGSERSQADSTGNLPKTKEKSPGRKNKIPSLLEDLHKSVSKVSMLGLNSHTQYSIEFVATPKGINQQYVGLPPGGQTAKHSALPNIRFDKQSLRNNNFLRVDDDANSERFEPFNCFVKGSHFKT